MKQEEEEEDGITHPILRVHCTSTNNGSAKHTKHTVRKKESSYI